MTDSVFGPEYDIGGGTQPMSVPQPKEEQKLAEPEAYFEKPASPIIEFRPESRDYFIDKPKQDDLRATLIVLDKRRPKKPENE